MSIVEEKSLETNIVKNKITVREYADAASRQKKDKSVWDEFIANSKNGTFLFYRDYMEYHSDRFIDNSLMFFDDKDKLLAVMPANLKDNMLFSHGGLTYGGIISDNKMKTSLMMDIFDLLKEYLCSKGIEKVRYKTIPHIYHSIPAEEDLYALFINNASLVRRDASTTIYLPKKLTFRQGKKCNINKAKKSGLKVLQNNDFETFIEIEKKVLAEKYKAQPVHTSEEISLLASRFPENIKLFSAYREEEMLAGVIVYETKTVIHTQYMANSEKGRELNGLDLVIDYLINEYYVDEQRKDKKFFDFGISTEQEGRYLNAGLALQKENFGGRAIVYDTYEFTPGK